MDAAIMIMIVTEKISRRSATCREPPSRSKVEDSWPLRSCRKISNGESEDRKRMSPTIQIKPGQSVFAFSGSASGSMTFSYHAVIYFTLSQKFQPDAG
jgi:hypothetical protein